MLRRLIIEWLAPLYSRLKGREWHLLTAAAAAGQVNRRENTVRTLSGARPAVLLRACTHVPRASEDSGSGQGFLFHSRPQWIHLLGRYRAKPVSSPCALKLTQTPTNLHTKCHWGRAGGFENQGERIQPSVPPLPLTSLDAFETNFRWAEWSGEDRNIHQEINQCSVGFPVNRPFYKFHISFTPRFTATWRIYVSVKFLSETTPPLHTFLLPLLVFSCVCWFCEQQWSKDLIV